MRRHPFGTVEQLIRPVVEPISLDDLKDHLNMVGVTAFDDFLTRARRTARRLLELRLDRSFMDQSLRQRIDTFPWRSKLPLRRGPVTNITAIHYIDESGEDQLFDSDFYRLASNEIILNYGERWATTQRTWKAVYIDFDAGYTDVADVEDEVNQAIAMIVAEFFERRSITALKNLSKDTLTTVDSITGHLRTYSRLAVL
jgi:uncharacterized phiE125 gp8 family phage protein